MRWAGEPELRPESLPAADESLRCGGVRPGDRPARPDCLEYGRIKRYPAEDRDAPDSALIPDLRGDQRVEVPAVKHGEDTGLEVPTDPDHAPEIVQAREARLGDDHDRVRAADGRDERAAGPGRTVDQQQVG